MSYNNLINDRLGTYTIADDAAAIADAGGVDGFLYDGVMDVIENCRKYKPHLLPLFTTTTSQGGNTLANVGNADIIKVTSTTSSVVYPARFADQTEMTRALISGSIYEASHYDPIWGIVDRTITVLPASGSTAYGFTRIVPDTVDASSAPNASNPSNFPVDLHYLLATYATIKVLNYIAATKSHDAGTYIATAKDKIDELFAATANHPDILDIQDALDKAQNLIDGDAGGDSGTAESAQFWLLDEDPDMVSSTVSVAAQEISRASTIMSALDKKSASLSKYTELVAALLQEMQGILTTQASLKDDYRSFFIQDPESDKGRGQGAA